MWDIKLEFFELFNIFYTNLYFFFFSFINFFVNYLQNSAKIIHFFVNYSFSFNNTIIFGLKFLICIAFLVLIRGGTPRYRYDYLTKLGWLKFINIIIFIFFLMLITFYFF